MPDTSGKRKVNRERCRHPSFTLCQDLCPARMIDLSKDPLIIQNCWNNSLCNRICPYNAIEIEPKEMEPNMRTQYKIDLSKCVYPECRLCVENCPMDSIDFATKPPSFKYNCEGCDFLKKFKIAEKVL
ncbi:MAG: 4Fe-4S dicluster domain-containing protein [Candidatus Bathyarchaeia archaeon]